MGNDDDLPVGGYASLCLSSDGESLLTSRTPLADVTCPVVSLPMGPRASPDLLDFGGGLSAMG